STTFRPSSEPRIEKSASRTRSVVGRVLKPGGAEKRRPRCVPAMMRIGLGGFHFRPKLSAPLLSHRVAAREHASDTPGRHQFTLLPKCGDRRFSYQVRAVHWSGERLASETMMPRRLHGPL